MAKKEHYCENCMAEMDRWDWKNHKEPCTVDPTLFAFLKDLAQELKKEKIHCVYHRPAWKRSVVVSSLGLSSIAKTSLIATHDGETAPQLFIGKKLDTAKEIDLHHPDHAKEAIKLFTEMAKRCHQLTCLLKGA